MGPFFIIVISAAEADSLCRAKAVVCEVLFACKPNTPTVSRWTSCVKSARFYLLANACYDLLSKSFNRVYSSKNRNSSDSTDSANETTSLVAAQELLGVPSSEATLYKRKLRYRSGKAAEWLASRRMTIDLAIAVLMSGPVDHLLGWIFHTQSEQLHELVPRMICLWFSWQVHVLMQGKCWMNTVSSLWLRITTNTIPCSFCNL